MKQAQYYYFFKIVIVFTCLLMGHQSLGKITKPQSNSIVTSNKLVAPISEFATILDSTINEINSNTNFNNFILFVHGRGKHPEKAFDKSLILDIESNYSAKVIMFHWPSWEGAFSFPIKNAKRAAEDFSVILNEISTYKNKHLELTKGINFTLFTNSMGSFVLQESVITNSQNSTDTLFDTVLINAAASAATNHSRWVEKIKFSQNIFITLNAQDKLLGKIGTKLVSKRLGKGLTSIFDKNFDLATNAKYIDLTNSQLKHRYYLHKDFIDRPVAQQFYDQVLNGQTPILDFQHGVQDTIRNQIYIMAKSLPE